MLKNEELKQINQASVALGMIWAYAIEPDSDLYEKTGVTSKDLHDCMRALNHIYVTQNLKHKQASEQANAWNKAHPEEHRRHSREAHRRHPKERKEYQHQYYLKKKAQQ